MNAIEVTILSIVIMIALGYILKRLDFLSEDDITPLNKIVMNILLPCMIFSALFSADLSAIHKLGVLPIAIICSSFIVGIISFIILKKFGFDDKRLWSVLVTVMIANTAFMGYPVNLGVFGDAGFLRAIFCDLGTTSIFLILSLLLVLKFGGTPRAAVKDILLFPPLWAVVLGIIFNLCNIPIGPVVDNVVNYLGDGAIPLIMISLGLSINLGGLKWNKDMVCFTSIMKLFIFPIVMFAFVTLFHFTGYEYTIAIVEAAMPSGMLSLMLAVNYGLDYHLTSDCILMNTVFSLVTLPIIISLL